MKKTLKSFAASLLIAAAMVFGAGVVATLPDVAVYAQDCSVSSDPLTSGVNCVQPAGAPTELFGDGGIFTTIANILIFLVGIIAVIMLIIGGIRYAVSGGDDSAVKAAKNTILYAIVGLIVAFLAFAIVNFVVTQLQENSAFIKLLVLG